MYSCVHLFHMSAVYGCHNAARFASQSHHHADYGGAAGADVYGQERNIVQLCSFYICFLPDLYSEPAFRLQRIEGGYNNKGYAARRAYVYAYFNENIQ